MKKLLTIILVLCSVASFGQMRGGAQYDPGAARKNLSNVDSSATPSMKSITLSDKVQAAWANILGDIYASGTVKVGAGTAAAPAYTFSSDPNTGIYSAGADSIGFGNGGAEKIIINSNGEMLIATSTDAGDFKLQLNGTGYLGALSIGRASVGVPLIVYGDSGNNAALVSGTMAAFIQTSTPSTNCILNLQSGNTGSCILNFGDSDDDNRGGISYINGASNDAMTLNVAGEKMRITSSGKVLIGTSTDDGVHKLQVNGSMRLIGMAAPTPTEGGIYFNSSDKHLYVYNGTGWVQLDN